MIAAADDPNHHLSGHGGRAVAIQDHLPVVAAVGEDGVGPHAHPGGILTNAHGVAIVADLSLRVFEVSIPEEGWGEGESRDFYNCNQPVLVSLSLVHEMSLKTSKLAGMVTIVR